MLKVEARWIAARLAAIPDDELFPLLNVGSSTHEFRTRTQPYVDDTIFAPLRARGGAVVHLDVKRDPGVDLVGDLADPAFLDELAAMRFKSVLICNLFEHVAERAPICEAILHIVAPGGYVIVTGPHDYPYHEDPIDTMFRPTVDEMAAHFPDTRVVAGAILDAGNWRQWDPAERGGQTLARAVLRLLMPFYRPAKWRGLARQAPYLFKHASAFGVVLQRAPVARSACFQ